MNQFERLQLLEKIEAKRAEIKSLSTKHGFDDSDVVDLVCDSIIKLVEEK
jgi:hypothetical protein